MTSTERLISCYKEIERIDELVDYCEYRVASYVEHPVKKNERPPWMRNQMKEMKVTIDALASSEIGAWLHERVAKLQEDMERLEVWT